MSDNEIKELLKKHEYIYTSNALVIDIDKNTQELIFKNKSKENIGKYTKQYSKALIQAWQIMENSPYKDYKEVILDPKLYTGQSSTLLEFKAWQKLYLDDPVKGTIAPWTQKEKAYYQSLKTKSQRYKYLVIRSGLRSAVIDIPFEAYACADDKELFKKYEHLFYEVEMKKNIIPHSMRDYAFAHEYRLASGILGNIEGFGVAAPAFQARCYQSMFLRAQLGSRNYLRHLAIAVECSNSMLEGLHWNKLRAMMIYKLVENYKNIVDEFGMIPYLDELIGVDWVMDFNRTPKTNKNTFIPTDLNTITFSLNNKIDRGELKDPRDQDSTPESRDEFLKTSRSVVYSKLRRYDLDRPNEWSEEEVKFFIEDMFLVAKIIAVTPPQDYPNAPFYYTPEQLERIYQRGALDRREKPTIPAIQREHFPEYLRKEIEQYAKEHNIKD